MREFLYEEARRRQFCPNSVQFVRDYDNIHIDCENGLDIAIYRKSVNEAPRSMLVKNSNQRAKVAAAPVRHRFEDFSRGHLLFLECAGRAQRRRRFGCPPNFSFSCRNNSPVFGITMISNYQPIQSAVAAALCRRTPNSIYQLEDSRRAHAATHAHRHHSVMTVAAFKLAQDRCGQLCSRAAERMTEGNRAAVDVDLIVIKL